MPYERWKSGAPVAEDAVRSVHVVTIGCAAADAVEPSGDSRSLV
jgi:hypothetical protein